MNKIICLDLDDTLIKTQENYHSINNHLVFLLQQKRKIPREDILETQSKIDIKLIAKQGFSPNRFPTSWVNTFKFFLRDSYFCEGDIFNEAYKVFTVSNGGKIPNNDGFKFPNNNR